MVDLVVHEDTELGEAIDIEALKIGGFIPSQHLAVVKTCVDMRTSVRYSAETMVYDAIGENNDYTDTEKEALIAVEELKALHGVDLGVILLRGEIINRIRSQNLTTFHPNGYLTLEEMAKDQGISTSALSQTMSLCFVIFPWIEENMQLPIAELWEEVGKSKFMELIPVLKALITGEAAHGTVQAAVERMRDEVVAVAAANGEELTPEQITYAAVDTIIHQAEHLTNRELRQHIRPEGTPSIQVYTTQVDGTRLLIAELTEEQWLMFQRLANGRFDNHSVSLDDLRREEIYRKYLR